MAGIASVSRTELAQRRRDLRRKRRLILFQTIWRTFAIATFAGILVWVVTLPTWVIRKAEQIEIEGNEFLSTQAVRTLLPLSYPQSLLQLQPQKIAENLESQAPIAQATVIRKLFPPSLTVQVQERHPVAIARQSARKATPLSLQSAEVGLLDSNGVWMPLTSYTSLKQSLKLPDLTIIGQKEHYRPYWSQLYQTISQSRVKITEIDWQDPANLIVKTDLAAVHLGSYSSAKLAEQLDILEGMQQSKEAKEKLTSSRIDYIDLRNPESPAVVERDASIESHAAS